MEQRHVMLSGDVEVPSWSRKPWPVAASWSRRSGRRKRSPPTRSWSARGEGACPRGVRQALRRSAYHGEG